MLVYHAYSATNSLCTSVAVRLRQPDSEAGLRRSRAVPHEESLAGRHRDSAVLEGNRER